ncbi:MAG: hypothetical protein ABJC04_04985, partial [Verrucomicrobiota bacterium]
WTAAFAVALVVLWCAFMQLRIGRANSQFKAQQLRWTAIEKHHSEVTENLKRSADLERKLAALNRLSTSRFLWGSTLGALQKTVVDPVQAVRIRAEQVYTLMEPGPARTNTTKASPAKPASAVERISVTIEAKDWNPAAQNYNKFKEIIAGYPMFQTNLAKADALRLTSLSKPAFDPATPDASFVTFTLEMHFPETRRNE